MDGDGTWSYHDKLLVRAVTVYRKTLCPSCGKPGRECEQDHQIETRTCGAEAAAEKYRKEHKDLPPGIMLTPVPSAVGEGQSAAAATMPDWMREKLAPQN